MGGEQGGPGGFALRFRPRRTRGVRGPEPPCFTSARRTRGSGGLAPGLGHGLQGGVWGLAPQFRPRCTRGGPWGLPPGLGHGVQGGVRGACPPV